MIFSPHIRQLFQVRGRPSVYTPAVGSPVSLRAIRQGGGQRIMMGFVKVSPERTAFHVLRADIPSPVAGAVLDWDGESFTIDAVQPVERDADGLMWELDTSWGLDVVIRSVTGSGPNQSPPQCASFKIGAAASLGASKVWIKSAFTVGKLVAGDKFTIDGDDTEYTVTGAGAVAQDSFFTGVPITPALVAAAPLDAAVTFDFARDYTVRAGIANYENREYGGTVLMGDRRIVILQSALDQEGMTDAPKAGDRVTIENQAFSTISAVAVYERGAPYAWELQLRKG